MFPSHDAPLAPGQRQVLRICTLFFPVLLFAYIAAFFWFRDTHPQRAQSLAGVGLAFMQGVLLAVMVVAGVQLLFGAYL